MLVDRRLITREQLDRALAQQRLTQEFLGTTLIRMGLIQPEALLTMLSEQFQIPRERLLPDRVDWSVAKQFPASVLSEGRCFPIRADEESVTVAIANPLDAWSLSAVERAARFRSVKPVLVSQPELDAVLQAYRQRLLQTLNTHLDNHGHP
jgi:hypothetical protein